MHPRYERPPPACAVARLPGALRARPAWPFAVTAACGRLHSCTHTDRSNLPFCTTPGHGRWFPRSSVPNSWWLRCGVCPGTRHPRAESVPADQHDRPASLSRAAPSGPVLSENRPERTGGSFPAPSGACIQTGKARQPFRCPATLRSVPGTTRWHIRNGTRLPCRVTAPHTAGFYLGHTPPLRRLKHPDVAIRAPGTNPAPAEVPALAAFVVRSFTSVAGHARRADRRTSGASAPAQSPHQPWCAFEGQKPEAPLYPSTAGLPGLAPSLTELTGKPFAPSLRLAIGPLVVELFAFRGLLGYPVLIGTGRVRRRTRAPHAGRVARASSAARPLVRDSEALASPPASIRRGSEPLWLRVVPRRPASTGH